jgi:hypothetical protein
MLLGVTESKADPYVALFSQAKLLIDNEIRDEYLKSCLMAKIDSGELGLLEEFRNLMCQS